MRVVNVNACADPPRIDSARQRVENGRTRNRDPDAPAAGSTSGGNRTPNRRFWRPVLYQLSYARSVRGG